MIHLNDSNAKLGTGKDSHATLTRGNIWGEYSGNKGGDYDISESGLMYILDYAEKNNIITILERNPEGLLNDLNLIRNLGFFNIKN